MNHQSPEVCGAASSRRNAWMLLLPVLLVMLLPGGRLVGAPAAVLFEDDFTQGLPGWGVKYSPEIAWLDGPLLWQYNVENQVFWEASNVYSDSAAYSWTRMTPMLINETVAPANFTFTARLTASDDDGFGLIWGYEDEGTFYRVAFGRQFSRSGNWPYRSWNVDRMVNGNYTDLFGEGKGGAFTSFTNVNNRPFDVTISVAAGLLTVSVTDDVTNAPVVYNLVTAQPLPSTAPGKVGLFSWGMSRIRYENLALAPQALTGTINPLAGTWTMLVTPRGDGTTDLGGTTPAWIMGANADGTYSRLREVGDAFYNAVDNTAAGSTNFAAPTAVAGDTNWTDYVYSARLMPNDDDGFGMMLRYVNETNWYRIAFRRQNSATGAKRGITIQKCVEGVFDEVVWNETAYPRTAPTLNVPADVYASMIGDRLQLMVVANPTAANATVYTYGPYDITGPKLANGKIGLFSWAMNYLQVDYARVNAAAGQALLVNSQYGAPQPPVGLNDFAPGTVVTATVPSLIVEGPGVHRVLLGWDGSGSVPTTGTTNEVVFTMNSLSSLVWKWQSEFLLTTSAGPGGSVAASLGPWVREGSNVTVTATANAGYLFSGWTGDTLSGSAALIFPMGRPVTLTANFVADADTDSLADEWETKYFGNLAQTGAGDADSDGLNNLAEYELGSNPTFAEVLVASDGLQSKWENVQRDPVLPSNFRVADFGSGFRGAYDNSNDFRNGDDTGYETNYTDNASFQGPILVLRSNYWTPWWATNFTVSAEFTVGDDDGSCLYFRYNNRTNWYRVTLVGEYSTSLARPVQGLSVQTRTNGAYTQVLLGSLGGWFAPDPNNELGPKRVKVTVSATNDYFYIQALPWNTNTAAFDEAQAMSWEFYDASLSGGTIGFGSWGMGATSASNNTAELPIPSGVLVDNIRVSVGGVEVLSETWETAPLWSQLPAGWENPYLDTGATGGPEGDWQVSAHGTIVQRDNYAQQTSGTVLAPKADGDGPILLAPAPGTANYVLQIGLHPFDNDGIGFVYNFYDTNNFSRVLLESEASGPGRVPRGISVSRKVNGVWSDIFAGDVSPTFVYAPGQAYGLEFANNNGQCTLVARNLDLPATTVRCQWTDAAPTGPNRFGLTTWGEQDAHFLYARALSLPEITSFEITGITVTGTEVTLTVSKPSGKSYDVLRSSTVGGPYTPVATNQTANDYTELMPAGETWFYRLQLVP